MDNYSLAVGMIKQSVSAIDVANAIGWEVKHGRCRCPIHNGGDMNCRLYPGDRGFHCFSCGASGDVIKLVQQYYSLSFKECLAWFNDTFRMGLNLNSSITPEQRRQAEKALQRRKKAIEHQEWMDRMRFNLALTADDIVRRMENLRDERQPRTVGEEWNADFCNAVENLPNARRFADDCMMDCMKEVQG